MKRTRLILSALGLYVIVIIGIASVHAAFGMINQAATFVAAAEAAIEYRVPLAAIRTPPVRCWWWPWTGNPPVRTVRINTGRPA